MTSRAYRLRQFGYLCICVSASLSVMLTFGYSVATADRATSVEVVNDENALIGIFDNTALSTQSVSATEEAVFFVNDNLNVYDTATTDDIAVTLEAFGTDESPSLQSEVSTHTDHDWQIQLACGTETGNLTGTATVTIETTGEVDTELTRTTSEEVEANCNSE